MDCSFSMASVGVARGEERKRKEEIFSKQPELNATGREVTFNL